MNPYKVLGVPEGADKETIRKAYYELVKKYHPDQYANNPLSDLAQEKMKEINQAYDMLMNQNSSKGGNGGGSASYRSGGGTYYSQVRELIQRRQFDQALELLSTMPRDTAEWNYLMGVILINRGWYDRAIMHLNTAVNMEPSNMEYRSTRDSVLTRAQTFRNVGQGMAGGASACDFCTTLLCADCLCECCGGDLISCC